MAFLSAVEIHKEHGTIRPGRRSSGAELRFATDKGGKSAAGIEAFYARFTLSKELMEAARLIKGDRVNILFDPDEGRGIIIRVGASEPGWSLSGPKTSTKITLSLTWREGIPSIASTGCCTDVKVTRSGIEFKFPFDTSFSGNARSG